MNRRNFLKSAAGVGSGLMLLPSGTLLGAAAPSNKLNVAFIGVWGRGRAHRKAISTENVVAVCDVDERHLAEGKEVFPKADTYLDWRKCLERKDLDAIVCCTTDHTHAHVSNWAMERGLHVYCEKPVGNSVEETRVCRATYLKYKDKIATQMGTQRHAHQNFNRVRELVRDGAIGELKKVSAWGNRQLRRPGYLPPMGNPPKHLHYDLWIGPSPFHPYNPGYFSRGAGANCLSWNMYWDFGSGQVGDMGSHTMDLAWNAIDAGLPSAVEASGDAYNPEVTPVELEAHFDHPANDWRSAIQVSWYQGGRMPESPSAAVDLNKIGHGAMFEGTKGVLISDFHKRLLIPNGDDADLSYYNRRAESDMIPAMDGFMKQWIDAAKGDLKTSCNFDYSCRMMEQMHLGLVAYRAGKKIDYDGSTGQVTNSSEGNDLLKRSYRSGWPLSG